MPKQDLKCQSKSKPEEEGLEPLVLSGMRASASIVIWVDVKRSLKGGVKWWRAKNGVYLTEGLVVGRKKLLALEWIWWVERRARPGEETEVLFGEKPAKVDGIARAGEVDGKMKGLLSGEPESGLPVKDNWDDPE